MNSDDSILDDLQPLNSYKQSTSVIFIILSIGLIVLNPILASLVLRDIDGMTIILATPIYAITGIVSSLLFLLFFVLLVVPFQFLNKKTNFFVFRILYIIVRSPLYIINKLKIWGLYFLFHFVVFLFLLYFGFNT